MDRVRLSESQERTDNDNMMVDLQTNNDPEQVPLWKSIRLLVCLFGSLSTCTSFASQTSMTSAMVCMIEYRSDNSDAGIANDSLAKTASQNSLGGWPSAVNTNNSVEESNPWTFSWNSETQGYVVSSFFVGYYIMQIPSGVIVTKMGPKRTLVASLLATGVLHILSVPAAIWNIFLLCVIRTVAGITNGCILAAAYGLAGNWAPRQETSMLFGLTGMGMELGNALPFVLSLVGCELGFQGGWPIVFYGLGSIQLVLGVVVTFWVTDFPSTHRYISGREINYIDHHRAHKESKSTQIPYKKIFCSLPVWAFLAAELATECFYYILCMEGPIFMRDILQLSHWMINLIASAPYVFIIPIIVCLGYICDEIMTRGWLSRTNVRKSTEGLSKVLTAVPVVLLGLVPVGNSVSASLAYCLAAIGTCFIYMGLLANAGDLSPRHAGFLTGLGQAMTTWVTFLIPVLTGYITSEKTRESWMLVFYTNAGIQAFALLFYILFGSGELQPWAEVDEEYGTDEKTPIVKKGTNNQS